MATFNSNLDGKANIGAGGGGSIIVQEEGGVVPGGPHTTLNFTGAGATASNAGSGVATINIPGGGATPALSAVLAVGNTTGGTDLAVSSGDRLVVDGSPTFRASATGVATGTDLSPFQVITNPNAGVSSQIVHFKARVVAFATGGPVDTACWLVEGIIVRENGTDTVLFPTPPVITPLYNSNAVDWDVIAVADDGAKALKFTVTVDGFGLGPGAAPSASFFAQTDLMPAGTPL